MSSDKSYMESAKDQVGEAAGAVQQKASDLTGMGQQKADEASHQASETTGRAKQKADDMTSGGQGYGHNTGGGIGERAQEAGDVIKDKAYQAKESVTGNK